MTLNQFMETTFNRKDILDTDNADKPATVNIASNTEAVLAYDSKLSEKVRKLEKLKMGSNPQAELILVLAGQKPTTEVMLYAWNSPIEEVLKVLKEIGLKTEVDTSDKVNDNHVGTIRVAKDADFLKRLAEVVKEDSSEAKKEYGLLMGYPPTAVEAFVKEDLLPDDQYPKDKELFSLFQFKLSRGHWNEEVQIVRSWNNTIKKYAPQLWQEAVTS